jgi:hypothetical protein
VADLTKLLLQCSQDLRDEIAYRLELFEEGAAERDEGEVFTKADALREIADDADEADHPTATMRHEILRILIKVGCYEPISDADAKESVRCGMGVKLRHYPKLDGQRYVFVGWEPLTKSE